MISLPYLVAADELDVYNLVRSGTIEFIQFHDWTKAIREIGPTDVVCSPNESPTDNTTSRYRMQRIDADNITITQDELNDIAEFIRSSLYFEWDRYTDQFITGTSLEHGMRQMNPEMYDLMQKMRQL